MDPVRVALLDMVGEADAVTEGLGDALSTLGEGRRDAVCVGGRDVESDGERVITELEAL